MPADKSPRKPIRYQSIWRYVAAHMPDSRPLIKRLKLKPGDPLWFEITHPGDASKVIRAFDVQPGDRVWLLLRRSSSQKGHSFATQRYILTKAVEAAGGIVVGVTEITWSGRGNQWFRDKLPSIRKQALDAGATILLATTMDRFARSWHFNSTERYSCDCRAQEHQLDDLFRATRGLRCMTLAHPNATAGECRKLRKQWGDERQGEKAKNGRGNKHAQNMTPSERRAKFEPIVVELARQGFTDSLIHNRLADEYDADIPVSTIASWRRNAGMMCPASAH